MRLGNLQLLDDAQGNSDSTNRDRERTWRFCPGSYADVGSALREPTEEHRSCFRPYFYNEPTPAEILVCSVDPCDNIDDAVEAQDWRISATHE